MKKSRFSEKQIIDILKEQQAGLPITEMNLRQTVFVHAARRSAPP